MDNWARALQAAESAIEENLSQVNRITIWLVGGVSGSTEKDQMSINACIVDYQEETTKLHYDIPDDMVEELDTEKAVMGYAVEVITNHLVLPRYFEKFD